MTTVELEPIINGSEDEYRIIHLYRVLAAEPACGAEATDDWHKGIHGDPIGWRRGILSCPMCGAPICMDCVLGAMDAP